MEQQTKAKIAVRPVPDCDQLRRRQLSSTCFHYKDDKIVDAETLAKELERERSRTENYCDMRGNKIENIGAYMGERLVANAIFHAYTMRFDGHDCCMSGVGGVISDPETRRNGAIRAIFLHQFEKMRQQGQIFSMLQPFSTEFYRQFGYEASLRKILWDIPIELMPAASNEGIVRYEGTDAQKADIKKVYADYTKNLNLALVRDDTLHWKEHFEHWEPYKSDTFQYLHYDKNGRPDAFFAYLFKYSEPPACILEAMDSLFYSNVDGLKALLSFLKTYYCHAERVKFFLPELVDISYLLPQLNRANHVIERTYHNNWMARVVDAEEVLKLARYQGSGSFTVRIADAQCPWNEDTFAVSFGSGETSVSRGAKDADLTCDIRAFTTLITGKLGFDEIDYLPNTVVCGNAENLRKAFYRKPLWIGNYF